VTTAAVAPAEPTPGAGGGTGVIEAYRSAYAAWRNDDTQACIDQFRLFLQTNASSPFADDAAFWMADCYFKQGDYKTAILRFDDVVSRYPTGNKAADALYRQGEALLRLGPGYAKAAGKAFERVVREYPDSDRAIEARRQLEILATG
jgi:tol-pal system protein YbgF